MSSVGQTESSASTTRLTVSLRNLPAKSVEETLRHKMEYEEMVAGARRRGEARLRPQAGAWWRTPV